MTSFEKHARVISGALSHTRQDLASATEYIDDVLRELQQMEQEKEANAREDLLEKACAAADTLRRSSVSCVPCVRELIVLCDMLRGRPPLLPAVVGDPPIGPDEFHDGMRGLVGKQYDDEEFHIHADEYLCETLRSLGYGLGVSIFEREKKNYGPAH